MKSSSFKNFLAGYIVCKFYKYRLKIFLYNANRIKSNITRIILKFPIGCYDRQLLDLTLGDQHLKAHIKNIDNISDIRYLMSNF